jgi:hypothetical protein
MKKMRCVCDKGMLVVAVLLIMLKKRSTCWNSDVDASGGEEDSDTEHMR